MSDTLRDLGRRYREADMHVPLLLGGLAVAVVLETIMIVSFVGALHAPKPHKVPVAVVGPPPVATKFAAQVGAASHGSLKIKLLSSPQALTHAIDHRDVYGGVILGQNGMHLVVADAASAVAPVFLEAFFGGVAKAQNAQLTVTHVKPFPAGDTRGTASFALIVSLVFGGYFGATILSVLQSTSSPSRLRAAGRMSLLAAYAVVSGLVAALVSDVAFDALTGNFAGLWGISAFIVFATAAATAGLQAAFGMPGTGIALISFILIGNPSTGGPVTTEFLPGFWRAVGQWLPGGAGITAIRNIVYFDGNGLGRPLAVLAAYAVAGSALAIGVGWRRRRLENPEIELASAAAL